MKKLLILSISAVFALNCLAQGQKKEEPTVAAKSAFAAKYPKAQKPVWSIEKPGEYEVEFTLNGIESSALFDAKGKFLECETEIKESELPQATKTFLNKEFAGYKIREIEKATDARGIVTYEMEAEKSKIRYELVFDGKGNFLKKEEETEAKEKE